MCGICGVWNGNNSPVNGPGILDMFSATDSRGRDAAGFAASVEDKLYYYKKDISSSKMVLERPVEFEWKLDGRAWIGHCRLGTHGSAQNPKNNHPFYANGYALIHNGIISNWYEYDQDCAGECDSEVILRRILHHKEGGESVEKSIQLTCSELEGDMACALINRRGDLWLWRREASRWSSGGFTPIALAWTPDRPLLHFASTHGALSKSLSGNGWLTASVEAQVGFHIYQNGQAMNVKKFDTPDEPPRQQWRYLGGGTSVGYKKSPDCGDCGESYCDACWDDDLEEGAETTAETAEEWLSGMVDDSTTYCLPAPNGDDQQGLVFLMKNGDLVANQTGEVIHDPRESQYIYVCDICTEYLLLEELSRHREKEGHAQFRKEELI